MKIPLQSIAALFIIASISCQSQTGKTMQEKNNPLLCNPETGVCEMPVTSKKEITADAISQQKPIRIIYFTDPICSSCWGIEPQLRKLKLEYGQLIEIEYRMGGLLPDWSYNSGGISKPSDVAQHWDEVSAYYDMPIDGDVWLESPLDSSYPPSIAFKAAQLQDSGQAVKFLRRIREMVFLEKKNITQWENLHQAALETGLDVSRLKTDYGTRAKELFRQDLELARKLGVRGFPTLLVTDGSQRQEIIYGFKPYLIFEKAVLNVDPEAAKKNYDRTWLDLFGVYPTLTVKEYSELSGLPRSESQTVLQQLQAQGKLKRWDTKNGAIYKFGNAGR